MPRHSPYHIALRDEERADLAAKARAYTSPYCEVLRAKIALLAAQGLRNDEIATSLSGSARTTALRIGGRSMIGYVSILRLVLVALIVVPLLSVLPAPEARAAATSHWCGDTIYDEQRYVGDPNCKYALAKAGYDPRDRGATFVDSLWIRGGTASKTCDPSNNVHQWAIDTDHGSGGSGPASAFLYTAPEGYVFWSRGRISYKDSCDSNSSAALSIFQVDKYTT